MTLLPFLTFTFWLPSGLVSNDAFSVKPSARTLHNITTRPITPSVRLFRTDNHASLCLVPEFPGAAKLGTAGIFSP